MAATRGADVTDTFQSTLSVRRATTDLTACHLTYKHFNPRSP